MSVQVSAVVYAGCVVGVRARVVIAVVFHIDGSSSTAKAKMIENAQVSKWPKHTSVLLDKSTT